jgi:hypothetical protein
MLVVYVAILRNKVIINSGKNPLLACYFSFFAVSKRSDLIFYIFFFSDKLNNTTKGQM